MKKESTNFQIEKINYVEREDQISISLINSDNGNTSQETMKIQFI